MDLIVNHGVTSDRHLWNESDWIHCSLILSHFKILAIIYIYIQTIKTLL